VTRNGISLQAFQRIDDVGSRILETSVHVYNTARLHIPQSNAARTSRFCAMKYKIIVNDFSFVSLRLSGFEVLAVFRRTLHSRLNKKQKKQKQKQTEIIHQEQTVKTLVQELPLLDPCQKPTNY
jgi:hypothetical protein